MDYNLTTEGQIEAEELMFQLLVQAIEDHETLPDKISEIRRDGSDVIIESDEIEGGSARLNNILDRIKEVRAVHGDEIDTSHFLSTIRSVIPSEKSAQVEEWRQKLKPK